MRAFQKLQTKCFRRVHTMPPVPVLRPHSVTARVVRLGTEIVTSIQKMEKHLGRKASALMALEIGGLNGLQALTAGARLGGSFSQFLVLLQDASFNSRLTGLPVVDGDLMGRAFPKLPMVIPAFKGM